jgi:hypothetical protein
METVIKQNAELEKVVSESGLQLNEAEEIKQSYLPYFEQLAEIKEQSKKINFENPTELDEKIARELRLKMVKIRTGSESVKEARKKIHSLKANTEQASWNLIKATCQLDEEIFLQVEKKREIAEKKRVELLKSERIEILSAYVENAAIYPLGEMSETAFEGLLNGQKLAKEAKLKAEREIELAKIEAENNAIRERAKIKEENERLKKEAEIKEAALKIEREKAEAERKAIEDKAKKELAAKEAIRLSEQKKADELLEAQRKQAAVAAEKVKAESEAKLKKEREANEKLKAEIQAKAEAERKAEEAKQAELLAMENEKKEALRAPELDQLQKWIDKFTCPAPPVLKDKILYDKGNEILTKFHSFKKWANMEIGKY